MSSLETVGSAGEGETVVAILSPASAQGKPGEGWRRGKCKKKGEEDEKEGWNKKKSWAAITATQSKHQGPGIVGCCSDGNQEEQNGKITGCGVDARGKWTSDDGLACACLLLIIDSAGQSN